MKYEKVMKYFEDVRDNNKFNKYLLIPYFKQCVIRIPGGGGSDKKKQSKQSRFFVGPDC